MRLIFIADNYIVLGTSVPTYINKCIYIFKSTHNGVNTNLNSGF